MRCSSFEGSANSVHVIIPISWHIKLHWLKSAFCLISLCSRELMGITVLVVLCLLLCCFLTIVCSVFKNTCLSHLMSSLFHTHARTHTLTHLKLVKTQDTGFIADLHGNRRDGVIGEHFPQPPLRSALFPPVDPLNKVTQSSDTNILKHTCIWNSNPLTMHSSSNSSNFTYMHNGTQLWHQDQQRVR